MAARRHREPLPLLEKVARDGPLPLSYAQERLWFLDRLESGGAAYNIPRALRLRGQLEIAVLRRVLTAIVARHEALRTTFHEAGGQPYQQIAATAQVLLPEIDLTSLSATASATESQRWLRTEQLRCFDLARGPLFAARLIRLADDEALLILNMHHIISDGWSIGNLFREIGALYPAFLEDRPAPLPALSCQAVDHAVWQRRLLTGKRLARHLTHWRQRLADLPPLLELPLDRPRPAVAGVAGASQSLALGKPLSDDLQKLARRLHVTTFGLLAAAFQALLHRLSHVRDIVFGYPVAGRTVVECEDLIGFFVNTLVLVHRFTDDPSFATLVDTVFETLLADHEHGELPFDRLVDDLQPRRDLGYSPIFQVMFALQNAPIEPLRLPRLTVSDEPIASYTAKFDLSLSLSEGSDGLSARLEYRTSLFDATTARRLLRQLRQLLAGAVRDPRTPVSRLPLLSAAQQHQLLYEDNDTYHPLPPRATLASLFAGAAQRFADEVAVVGEDRQLTYRQLDTRARVLARRLRAAGIDHENRVGIAVDRSPELIVALVATLQAGAVYVPLARDLPHRRRRHLLHRARLAALVCDAANRPLLEAFQGPILSVFKATSVAARPAALAWPEPVPAQLAYALFTSGSTGEPKAVEVSHRAVVRLLYNADYTRLDRSSRVLQLAPVAFDASTFEIWAPLVHGARLVLAPSEPPTAPALAAMIARHGVTHLWLTAGLFHQIVEADAACLGRLRHLLTGGDVVSPQHVERLLRACPGLLVSDLYGPTESTTFATCQALAASARAGARVAIGRPIANIRVYLLDRQLRPVARGLVGEIFLAGPGLARGYGDDPRQTAERFRPDPFAGAGGRLYRSGDLARYLADGRIDFLGRGDRQIKLRGFRVELEEIETVLRRHADIDDVAVVHERQRGRLVAFVVTRAGAAVGLRSLRTWLAEELPDYMFPASFARVTALPLGKTGKVDRGALLALDSESLASDSSYLAPRHGVERQLVEIWARVLQLDDARVGIGDNFFELGGDSLQAIQVVSQASRVGLELSVRQMLRHQTIAELAASLGEPSALRHAEQGEVIGSLPLTPGQCWYFDRVHAVLPARGPGFTSIRPMELLEPLAPRLLYRAAAYLLRHHDALRLRLRQHHGAWQQRCTSFAEAAASGFFTLIDLSRLAAAQQRAATLAYLEDVQGLAASGPLARFVVVDMRPRQPGRLVIYLHHLVSDGVSWRLLLDDLETVCRQVQRGEPLHLPRKTTPFLVWARRQAEMVAAEEMKQEEEYWQSLARHSTPLPTDFTPAADAEEQRDHVISELAPEFSHDLLRRLPARLATRFTNLLLAALTRACQRWTGAPSLLLRQASHGRDPIFDDIDLSRTLGWIATTAPLVLQLEAAAPTRAAVVSIERQLRDLPHRGIGYGLLRYMSTDTDLRRRMEQLVDLPALTFNFLGHFEQILQETPLWRQLRLPARISWVRLPRKTPQLRLHGSIGKESQRLRFVWDYSRLYYRRETIEGLAQLYCEELQRLVDSADEGKV